VYVEQAWQKSARRTTDADLEWAIAEGDDDDEEWECVVCGKSFRSEAAWNSHERSRKHLQAVEKLRQEMQDENDELGLDDETKEEIDGEEFKATNDVAGGEDNEDGVGGGPEAQDPSIQHQTDATRSASETDELVEDQLLGGASRVASEATSGRSSPTRPSRTKKKAKQKHKTVLNPELDVHVLNGNKLSALAVGGSGTPLTEDSISEAGNGQDVANKSELSKREKRRAKEAAKKAQATAASTVTQKHVCNVCGEEFESKTKLFTHVKEEGHAAATRESKGGSKGKGNKRGK